MEEVGTLTAKQRQYRKYIKATDLGQEFNALEGKDQLQLNKKILKWSNVLKELQRMSAIETYPVQEKIPNTKPKKSWDDDWETDKQGRWIFRDALNPDGTVKMRKSMHDTTGIRNFLDSQFHTKFLEFKELRSVVSDYGYVNDFNKPLFKEYMQVLKDSINDAVQIFNTREKELEKKQKEEAKVHQNTEVECGCGGHYSIRNKLKHFETKKHEKWAETQDPEEIIVKSETKDNPQNKEVICECGGKYSVRNKLKHFATGKHTKWLEDHK